MQGCRPDLEVNVDRPTRFENHRYLGDKRKQVVYDLDAIEPGDEEIIEELMAAEQFISFAPDTLPEARNRGYRLWSKHMPAAAEEQASE